MSLVPWRQKSRPTELMESDPLGALGRLRSEMDRVFDRFFGGHGFWDEGGALRSWAPAVDVTETDTEVTVRAEMPGIAPGDIEVTVSGEMLTISGEKKETRERKGENFFQSERHFGSFRRSVALPASVDSEKVSAEHQNGVLTVTLKKKQSALPKRITVKPV